MAMTISALATELQTDPAGLGYAVHIASGADGALAELLNTVRAGAAYAVYRPDIPAKELIAVIAPSDFTALTQLLIAKLNFLFTGGVVDATNANTRQILTNIFSGASAPTTSALTTLATRQGSRAEVLWGAGTYVSTDDIAQALRG